MRRAAILSLLFFGCTATSDNRADCGDCTIEVEHIAVFGEADGVAALPGMASTVARDSRRRLLVGTFDADWN